MPEPPASIEIRREDAPEAGGMAVLVVTGELDLAVSSHLEAALDPGEWGEAGGLVLDLSAVGFIDSSGIRVVATRIRELSEAGVGACAVVAPGGAVFRTIELSGLNELLPLEPDRASAERRLSDSG